MKVNLNTATISELRAVGFGQAAADGVVAFRERQPYKDVKELLMTRRIGNETYQKVKDSVYIGGTCPNCGHDSDKEWLFCPYCGKSLSGEGGETCYLYQRRIDNRCEYYYGPEALLDKLLANGGYPSPQEARLAWLREIRNG